MICSVEQTELVLYHEETGVGACFSHCSDNEKRVKLVFDTVYDITDEHEYALITLVIASPCSSRGAGQGHQPFVSFTLFDDLLVDNAEVVHLHTRAFLGKGSAVYTFEGICSYC